MLKDNPRGNYGIDQYRPPLNYELAGRSFTFVMDDGVDQHVSFLDGKTLEWNFEGQEPRREEYECLKADETTYLMYYEIEGAEKRTGHTFVIDLENMLVTRLTAVNGEDPKDPYVNNSYFTFGAILKPDGTAEARRHSFTDEVVGTCVQWCYGIYTTVHVYYCTDFYRITFPQDSAANIPANEQLSSLGAQLPSSDEPASYIRIKDNMYFVNITERNMERLLGEKGKFRCNAMCFLQNYDRMYMVGRAFGAMTVDGKDTKIKLSFGAYGKFAEVPEHFFTDPNPYIV